MIVFEVCSFEHSCFLLIVFESCNTQIIVIVDLVIPSPFINFFKL